MKACRIIAALTLALAAFALWPVASYAPGVPGQYQARTFTQDPALLARLSQLWLIGDNRLVALTQSERAEGLWERTVYYVPPDGFDLAAFEVDPSRRLAALCIVRQDPYSPRLGPVLIRVLRLNLETRAESLLYEASGSYTSGVAIVSKMQISSRGALAIQTELRSQQRCLVYLPDGREAFGGDQDWVERCAGFSVDGRYALGLIDGGAQGRASYVRRADINDGAVQTFTFPGAQRVEYLPRWGVAVTARSDLQNKRFTVVRLPENEQLAQADVQGFAALLDDRNWRLPYYALTDERLLSWKKDGDLGLAGTGSAIQLLAAHPTKNGYVYLRRDTREVFGFSRGEQGNESLRLFDLDGDNPYSRGDPTLLIERAVPTFWDEFGALQLIGRNSNRMFLIDFAAGTYYEIIAPLPKRNDAPWYRLDREAVVFLR
ncbi:MAG: hypothetical protein P9M14_14585 [Candidatus Alcyoniella australis]|nr:hypothetical protein [Candidatus Alcyoniella australis]